MTLGVKHQEIVVRPELPGNRLDLGRHPALRDSRFGGFKQITIPALGDFRRLARIGQLFIRFPRRGVKDEFRHLDHGVRQNTQKAVGEPVGHAGEIGDPDPFGRPETVEQIRQRGPQIGNPFHLGGVSVGPGALDVPAGGNNQAGPAVLLQYRQARTKGLHAADQRNAIPPVDVMVGIRERNDGLQSVRIHNALKVPESVLVLHRSDPKPIPMDHRGFSITWAFAIAIGSDVEIPGPACRPADGPWPT